MFIKFFFFLSRKWMSHVKLFIQCITHDDTEQEIHMKFYIIRSCSVQMLYLERNIEMGVWHEGNKICMIFGKQESMCGDGKQSCCYFWINGFPSCHVAWTHKQEAFLRLRSSSQSTWPNLDASAAQGISLPPSNKTHNNK